MPLANYLENRVLRYVAYGALVAVSTEAAYYIFKFVRKQFNGEEICEVIWTSELTQACLNGHYGQDNYREDMRSGKHDNCTNHYCVKHNVNRLIEYIDNAKYSIDLAMYTFTSHDLASAFKRAYKRNVAIRIISDQEMIQSSGSQVVMLSQLGISVRWPSSVLLMHHKFCIIDGEYRAGQVVDLKTGRQRARPRGVLLTGSLNWTMQGFGGNWENILITSNKKLINAYELEFARLWKYFNNSVSMERRSLMGMGPAK
ncbi:mitochondrial cardiolipin hydrolase [Teleopsis dalmanni]|uniref:mitochondrial cardiolipin hydrolase n=1 Tax=Teleopsis dalmanni TaxID=139649 RepID=UPI0018CD48BC|nr:mitochondrial cardiolipin hydrolase [Teleopsis dalmanni]